MALGMTYEQYWYGKADLVLTFREAHKYRVRMRNEEMFLQGAYIYQAVGAVADEVIYSLNGRKGTKPKGYLKEPLDIGYKTAAEKKEQAKLEREKAIQSLNRWKKAWEQRYGND